MPLIINLEKDKAKRLMKHLEKEHPSTKGKMCIRKYSTKIRKLPDFEKQARKMTKIKLKGGKMKHGNNRTIKKRH